MREYLRLERFGVSIDDNEILKDVSFSLYGPGVTVLLGPAGTGKSTLLRTLSGLNDPHPGLVTRGKVSVLGESFSELGDLPPTLRPALLRQHSKFYLDSVSENVLGGVPDRGSMTRTDQRAFLIEHLTRNGLNSLTEKLDSDVSSLSRLELRQLALARALFLKNPILMLDEPTAGLEEPDAERILQLILNQATSKTLLVVTHHKGHAQRLGGQALLLANGRILHRSSVVEFFAPEEGSAAHRFVTTGGYSSPPQLPESQWAEEDQPSSLRPVELSEPAPAEVVQMEPSYHPPLANEVELDELPPSQLRPGRSMVGPRGFYWVLPSLLGGMPRPGIFSELEHDLDGLGRLGVDYLITLEETETVPRAPLMDRGMKLIHFPIVDMSVPELGVAFDFCNDIEAKLRAGKICAMHCRAGQGRTGTMLACQLIYRGYPACAALEAVRSINPKCVESDEQVEFLGTFEAQVTKKSPLGRPSSSS